MNEILKYLIVKIIVLYDDKDLELTENMLLKDLQLDSINYIQLFICIEEDYGFEFDEEMLLVEKYQTLKDLAEYIYGKINQ